jgi:hypothetical protein
MITLDSNVSPQQYLEYLGIKTFNIVDDFYDYLIAVHGQEEGAKIEKAMNDRQQNKGRDFNKIYKIKNKSLYISLNFSSFNSELYRSFLDSLFQHLEFKPKKIIDIGCDNGVVTCYLALKYPNSEIIGIDPNKYAIECANQLADKLGLKNITFIQTTIQEFVEYEKPHSYDLVISLTFLIAALYEKINDAPRYFDIFELKIRKESLEVEQLFRCFSHLINDRGTYISFDRLNSSYEYCWYMEQLNKQNLYIDFNSSRKIVFKQFNDREVMPFFVVKKSPKCSNTRMDMLKFSAVESGFKLETLNKETKYENDIAEYVFQLHVNKSLYKGFQADFYDSSGILRCEIWIESDKILLYRFTDMGYRELNIYINRTLSKIENLMVSDMEKYIDYSEIAQYKSLFEKENIIKSIDY